MNKFKEASYSLPPKTHILILQYLEENGGLVDYDIAPFLLEKDVIFRKLKFGNKTTDNDRVIARRLFKDLEELGYLKIIEDVLLEDYQGREMRARDEKLKLIVRIQPKGIDYLNEYRKNKKENIFKKLTIGLLIFGTVISLINLIRSCDSNPTQVEIINGINENGNGDEKYRKPSSDKGELTKPILSTKDEADSPIPILDSSIVKNAPDNN